MTPYTGVERRRCARSGWCNTWRGKVLARMWWLIAYGDTAPIRFFLAIAATCWALTLALPGDSFSRPTFAYMQLMAPEWVWMIGFSVYAAVMFWRVFATCAAPCIAFVNNLFGLCLFSTVAFCVATIVAGPHCAIALASAWVLIRTNVNSPQGWRHD